MPSATTSIRGGGVPGILVVLADQSDLGMGQIAQVQPIGHALTSFMMVRPTRTVSAMLIVVGWVTIWPFT